MNILSRRFLSLFAMIALISSIGIFAAQYRRYGYAILWHCVHRSTIGFGEHKIQIPELWWATKADNYGKISISRAYRSAIISEPQIEVGPSTPGELTDSDGEQSRIADAVVSDMNRNPKLGWTHSVMVLRANESTWYCTRADQTILGKDVFTTLQCNAPRIPYSFYYGGPPEQEKEAESIFITFQ
jgi:hypothetical protein